MPNRKFASLLETSWTGSVRQILDERKSIDRRFAKLSVHLRPGVPVTEERVIRLSVSHEGHVIEQSELSVTSGSPERRAVFLAPVSEPGFFQVSVTWGNAGETLETHATASGFHLSTH